MREMNDKRMIAIHLSPLWLCIGMNFLEGIIVCAMQPSCVSTTARYMARQKITIQLLMVAFAYPRHLKITDASSECCEVPNSVFP